MDDCNYCEFCSPKECEQSNKKEWHMCKKYNIRLFHLGNHPAIQPYEHCVHIKMPKVWEWIKKNFEVLPTEIQHKIFRAEYSNEELLKEYEKYSEAKKQI